jgi:hypothetical protein
MDPFVIFQAVGPPFRLGSDAQFVDVLLILNLFRFQDYAKEQEIHRKKYRGPKTRR